MAEHGDFTTQPINLGDIADRLQRDIEAQANATTSEHDQVSAEGENESMTHNDAFREAFVPQTDAPDKPITSKPTMTPAEFLAEVAAGTPLRSKAAAELPEDVLHDDDGAIVFISSEPGLVDDPSEDYEETEVGGDAEWASKMWRAISGAAGKFMRRRKK